jgi:hypothetical protein
MKAIRAFQLTKNKIIFADCFLLLPNLFIVLDGAIRGDRSPIIINGLASIFVLLMMLKTNRT